jgi:hypothetical protein
MEEKGESAFSEFGRCALFLVSKERVGA